MNDNFKRILEDLPPSAETGRFFVKSERTGKVYVVEPIGDPHIKWGDVNPATGKVEGQYGEKNPGFISEKDSIITEAKNIKTLGEGVSPMSAIEEIDAQYPDKES